MRKPKHLYPWPEGFDPDDVVATSPRSSRAFAPIEREMQSTPAASERVFARWRAVVGSQLAPQLVWDCWTSRQITDRTLRRHLGSIWHTSEFPDYWLDHEQWRQMFQAVGYSLVRHGAENMVSLLGEGSVFRYEQGERATPPDRPLRVYRGAVRERRDDWSWTANPAVAARWASGRQCNRPPGRIWTTLAPPDHVLCRIERFDQYVIDTHGLTITEHRQETA